MIEGAAGLRGRLSRCTHLQGSVQLSLVHTGLWWKEKCQRRWGSPCLVHEGAESRLVLPASRGVYWVLITQAARGPELGRKRSALGGKRCFSHRWTLQMLPEPQLVCPLNGNIRTD